MVIEHICIVCQSPKTFKLIWDYMKNRFRMEKHFNHHSDHRRCCFIYSFLRNLWFTHSLIEYLIFLLAYKMHLLNINKMQYVCCTGCALTLNLHCVAIKKNKYYKPKKHKPNISVKQHWVVCSCRWMNAWIRSCIQLLVHLWLMNSVLLFIKAVQGNVIIWAWKWPWFCCSSDAYV